MTPHHRKTGAPPGTIIFTGEQKVDQSSINHLRYNIDECTENVVNINQIEAISDSENHVDWYDIRGLHDTDWLNQLGKIFSISPLILEDIVDVYKRPTYSSYEKGLLLIVKSLSFDDQSQSVSIEHIGIFFREGLLISFQEDESDLFHLIKKRLHERQGRVRQRGADYLMFTLCDLIVDYYFQLIEKLQSIIEQQEDGILNHASSELKESIHLLRKEIIKIRKQIYPLREVINQLLRSEDEIIKDSTDVYLRGLYDHSIHVLDMLDTQRDLLNGLQELYMSEINFKMNEVMKVLTIMTTIFVPLSFLAGIYGMNFEFIPELQFRNGYFILLGVMMSLVIGLLLWFRKKKWI